MAKSYVNVYQHDANHLRCLYIEDGVAKDESIKFKPFLGVHATSSENTKWQDMFKKPAKVIVFDSIMAMRNWKKENDVGLEILGDIKPEVQYIATQYRHEIPIQKKGMEIWNIDIEVFCESGFPHANLAQHPVNAITIQHMVDGRYTVISDVNYTSKHDNVTYIRCHDEQHILTTFVKTFQAYLPHIITGWNIVMFDIPYLVNRINRLLGPEMVKCLSREKVVKQHDKVNSVGQKQVTYSLLGHIIWDYMELYKKFCLEPRESYSLSYISRYELGEDKVDYSEFENLADLYKNDPEKFIDYNIKDTTLVGELDANLHFIDLALSIVYRAKCTPDVVFGTVQPWDCLIYNELLTRKILCPAHKKNYKQDFPGGFVKAPEVGLHKWVKVFDIVSSYPNQIRSFNMSPETILSDKETPEELRRLGERYKFHYSEDGNRDNDRCPTDEIEQIESAAKILQKYNVCWAANGHFFKKSEEGIIASIYTRLFNERKRLKKIAGQMKKEGNPDARSYDLAQHAYKILLNSGYGAMSNIHFRYFDIRIASAITTNGQTCARGVAKYLEKNIPLIKFIYADTDSGFYSMDKVVEKRFGKNIPDNKTVLEFLLKFSDKIIQPKIQEFYERLSKAMNMRELTIVMEPECIANASIHTAKKRYVMNKLWDEGTWLVDHPKLKVRGIEIVRTSSPQWVRDKLKEAVNLIFDTLDNDVLIKFIAKTKEEFKQQPLNIIGFPRSVTFSNYSLESKGIPIGVKAAFKYNQFIDIQELGEKYKKIGDGDKIKFVYLIEPNILKTHVIGILNIVPPELMEIVKIDYNTQFNKSFEEPLKSIFEKMGWKTEQVADLSDFFG